MARRMKSKTVVEYGQKFLMVFCAALMPINSRSLISAFASPPLPFSPWQPEHFSAKIGAPCVGVPLPFGNPVPSGKMLMSHGAMVASSTGLPRLGVSASKAPPIEAMHTEATKITCLNGNMLDLAVASHAPTGDRVVVLIVEAQNRRWFRQLAACDDKFSPGRLNLT